MLWSTTTSLTVGLHFSPVAKVDSRAATKERYQMLIFKVYKDARERLARKNLPIHPSCSYTTLFPTKLILVNNSSIINFSCLEHAYKIRRSAEVYLARFYAKPNPFYFANMCPSYFFFVLYFLYYFILLSSNAFCNLGVLRCTSIIEYGRPIQDFNNPVPGVCRTWRFAKYLRWNDWKVRLGFCCWKNDCLEDKCQCMILWKGTRHHQRHQNSKLSAKIF